MEQTSQTQAPEKVHERLQGVVAHDSPSRTLKKIYTFQDGLQAGLGYNCWEKGDLVRYTTVDEYLYFNFSEVIGSCDGLPSSEKGSCAYTPNRKFSSRFSRRTLLRHLIVALNRDFIDNRLGRPDHPGFPKDLLTALEQGTTGYSIKPFTITPWIRSLIHQVKHNPYQGRLGDLYAEARVLDLIVLCVEAMGGAGTTKGAIRLTPQDIERVRQAGHILTQRMENPPSLTALAREVGFSETKLKKGFRTVFDSTIFGYLRKHRLLRARDMLSGGDVTVFQAASAVGFANASHFSKAFFNVFGVLPGTYLGEAKDRATAVRKFPSGT